MSRDARASRLDAGRRLSLLQLPWLLGACAGSMRAPAPGHAAGRTPAPPPPLSPAAGLEVEQRWLQSWFDGTPVRIEALRDGGLSVEVPREFCFDARSSRIKPPLAAVLDKVAESLRRRQQVGVVRLVAPADAGAKTLVDARAAQVRKRLRERGVPAARAAGSTEAGDAALQLQLELLAD